MTKILFVGAEVMPYAATGGLGDVLGSLPKALVRENPTLDVRVIMPLYSAIADKYRIMMKREAEFFLSLAWREQYCGVYSLIKEGVIYYFIDNEYYFKREGIYGHFDDGERYAYFCMAVLEFMKVLNFYPDILHAHDWHGALSIVYLKLKFKLKKEYSGIKTVFTIHNIEYQGKFKFEILEDIFALSADISNVLEYNGEINFMKAAVELSDVVSTVSPKYAKEIMQSEQSKGLHYILKANSEKINGILNGIDYDYYNPMTDSVIWQNYSVQTYEKKLLNKIELQRQTGLPTCKEIPVISVISRLVYNKGIDLITAVAEKLLKRNIQLVILGSGERKYEDYFLALQRNYPQKVSAIIGYDRDMSKKIYSGSDIFLMPSISEPCGLSQMIASRYGTVPIIHEVGGLYDSIEGFRFNNGEITGNGFTFKDYNADVFSEKIYEAVNLYSKHIEWQELFKKVMSVDFSWNSSAEKYIQMYRCLIGL